MYFNLLFIVISISPIQHIAHEKFKRKPTSLMINFKIPINKPVHAAMMMRVFSCEGIFFYRITVPKEWREKLGRGYSHHILARRPTMAVSIVCSYNLLSFWPQYHVVCLVLIRPIDFFTTQKISVVQNASEK